MTYRGVMSEEQTRKAWKMQDSGMSDIAVAMRFHIDERTLYRSYRHYNLPRIKRKKKHKKK